MGINNFMLKAYELAQTAYAEDEVPVGCIIVKNNIIIAKTYNQVKHHHNAVGHAEILAISQACCALKSQFLDGCDLFVTLEPCPMCASAISHARIDNIYFGAYDLKSGGITGASNILSMPSLHHKPSWYGGIMEKECSQLLKTFFQKKR